MSYLSKLLLDLLLPQKPLVRELLVMEPEAFRERARRSELQAGKHTISLFDYRDPLVREAIWMLKYRGNRKIAALLGTLLYEELLSFLEEFGALRNFTDPLLIPIPLSKKRLRERGFNQCELLADELLRLDSSSVTPPVQGGVQSLPAAHGSAQAGQRGEVVARRGLTDSSHEKTARNFTLSLALTKIKDTPSQTNSETRKARMENLRGCFFIKDPTVVANRNVILIDDVVTTGATLQEARQTLLSSGARNVIAFTIAH